MRTCRVTIVWRLLGCMVAVSATSTGLARDCAYTEPRAKGKLSRNFYRTPYGDSTSVGLGTEYVNHCPPGSMDFDGPKPQSPPDTIVAAADGVIEDLGDSHNE